MSPRGLKARCGYTCANGRDSASERDNLRKEDRRPEARLRRGAHPQERLCHKRGAGPVERIKNSKASVRELIEGVDEGKPVRRITEEVVARFERLKRRKPKSAFKSRTKTSTPTSRAG